MEGALSELFDTLPNQVAPERGLLESLSAIGVRNASRLALPEVSASRQLLQEKQEKAAEEAHATPFTFAPAAPKAVNLVHEAIVESHKATMAEILARKGSGTRPKSKKANQRKKSGSSKGEAYKERFSAKTGGRDKRLQRMNQFKKQY